MPTNLPPEAKKKWSEVEATKNPRQRLRLLEEFLGLVPKHKGTAKLCVQVKKQIASLRKEIEVKKRKKSGRGGPKIFIEKEGAAQIAVIGLTNSGKSSLLEALTNARVEVSPNPYTTRRPVPGILNYEDIQFQIVEAPAIMKGSADGRAWGLQILGTVRNADGLILMVDLSLDPISQLSLMLNEMEQARILVSRSKVRVKIERKVLGAGLRIVVTGRLLGCNFKDVEELLKTYRVTDAIVKILGEATLSDVEDAIFESTINKPTIIVANKIDSDRAEEKLMILKSHMKDRIPIIAVSCEKRIGVEKLGEALFKMIDIIRVYTKEPSKKEHSKKPFILKENATITELAKNIHSDFKESFSFAKVWSDRLAFSPQKVGATFVLEDGDIVEIHLK